MSAILLLLLPLCALWAQAPAQYATGTCWETSLLGCPEVQMLGASSIATQGGNIYVLQGNLLRKLGPDLREIASVQLPDLPQALLSLDTTRRDMVCTMDPAVVNCGMNQPSVSGQALPSFGAASNGSIQTGFGNQSSSDWMYNNNQDARWSVPASVNNFGGTVLSNTGPWVSASLSQEAADRNMIQGLHEAHVLNSLSASQVAADPYGVYVLRGGRLTVYDHQLRELRNSDIMGATDVHNAAACALCTSVLSNGALMDQLRYRGMRAGLCPGPGQFRTSDVIPTSIGSAGAYSSGPVSSPYVVGSLPGYDPGGYGLASAGGELQYQAMRQAGTPLYTGPTAGVSVGTTPGTTGMVVEGTAAAATGIRTSQGVAGTTPGTTGTREAGTAMSVSGVRASPGALGTTPGTTGTAAGGTAVSGSGTRALQSSFGSVPAGTSGTIGGAGISGGVGTVGSGGVVVGTGFTQPAFVPQTTFSGVGVPTGVTGVVSPSGAIAPLGSVVTPSGFLVPAGSTVTPGLVTPSGTTSIVTPSGTSLGSGPGSTLSGSTFGGTLPATGSFGTVGGLSTSPGLTGAGTATGALGTAGAGTTGLSTTGSAGVSGVGGGETGGLGGAGMTSAAAGTIGGTRMPTGAFGTVGGLATDPLVGTTVSGTTGALAPGAVTGATTEITPFGTVVGPNVTGFSGVGAPNMTGGAGAQGAVGVGVAVAPPALGMASFGTPGVIGAQGAGGLGVSPATATLVPRRTAPVPVGVLRPATGTNFGPLVETGLTQPAASAPQVAPTTNGITDLRYLTEAGLVQTQGPHEWMYHLPGLATGAVSPLGTRSIESGAVVLGLAGNAQGPNQLRLNIIGADGGADNRATIASAYVYNRADIAAGRALDLERTGRGAWTAAFDPLTMAGDTLAVRVRRPGRADEVVYFSLLSPEITTGP